MKYISYCFSTLLLLFFLSSCGSESTPVYNLTTTPTPDEAGSVSPSSGEYDEGETVEILATPNEDWIFDGWEGDVSGSDNPTTVTIDADKDIAAVFVVREYPLTIEIEGEGTVQEEVIQEKTTDYPAGTTVELTANAADGWEFVEWSGDLNGSENPETISVQEETSVTAIFAEVFYSVDISLDGKGSVSETLIEGEESENGYTFGSEIKLEVEGSEDYNFVHWDGGLEGTDNPKTLIIQNNNTATAMLHSSPFAGGNGSELYPYQVSTIEQLQEIRNYTDKHFVQINDIDANATLNWNEGKGFRSIGDDIVRFQGSYDGNGYSILNMNINRNQEDNIGFIGFLGTDGIIENVSLKNISISGNTNVGGIVGYNYSGRVIKSNSTGSVTGNFRVGGVTGWNRQNALISDSYSESNVHGNNNYVGGLVGHNYSNSQIINSYSTGEVEGRTYVGGLIGANFIGDLENLYSTAKVTGESDVGGLIGMNQRRSKIRKSYSSGEVTGTENVGGLVGKNMEDETISNSYSNSKVTGEISVGGIVGSNSSQSIVSESFSYGEVLGNEDVGGLIGINGGSVDLSYWNTESSNQSNGVGRGGSDGITGLNTSEMQGSSAEDNMPEFDWDEIWMTVSGDYPILRWQQ